MKALLDTHAFLWWITNDPRLSDRARQIIADPGNELFLSAASGWEIAIKARLGKLKLPNDLQGFVAEQLTINAVQVLPVQMAHALHVYDLPEHHRDPFDRLLVAQGQLEDLAIVTDDLFIARYAITVLW